MEKKRTTELDDFKSEKALRALSANRKYRQNIKNKLASNTAKDERMDEILDILREIKKRMDATEDTDTESESDTDSEEEQVVKKKKKKMEMESDSEEEEQVVKKKKTKVVDKPKKKTKAVEEDKPKKKAVRRVKPESVLEPDISDDLQLQRKFPALYNYPTYV